MEIISILKNSVCSPQVEYCKVLVHTSNVNLLVPKIERLRNQTRAHVVHNLVSPLHLLSSSKWKSLVSDIIDSVTNSCNEQIIKPHHWILNDFGTIKRLY